MALSLACRTGMGGPRSAPPGTWPLRPPPGYSPGCPLRKLAFPLVPAKFTSFSIVILPTRGIGRSLCTTPLAAAIPRGGGGREGGVRLSTQDAYGYALPAPVLRRRPQVPVTAVVLDEADTLLGGSFKVAKRSQYPVEQLLVNLPAGGGCARTRATSPWEATALGHRHTPRGEGGGGVRISVCLHAGAEACARQSTGRGI